MKGPGSLRAEGEYTSSVVCVMKGPGSLRAEGEYTSSVVCVMKGPGSLRAEGEYTSDKHSFSYFTLHSSLWYC